MWKYMTRRVRDTFERGANHFDKRGTTGVVNAGNINDDKNKRSGPPCRWFNAQRCWGSNRQDNNTNHNNGWNFEYLTSTWMGAITWSGALVLGWYTSQLIQWKYNYYARRLNENGSSNLLSSLHPYICSVNKNPAYLNSVSKLEKLVGPFKPTVHLVTNDQHGVNKQRINSSSTDTDNSNDMLGDVLNSIENKLGLAAIENGQLNDGVNLLRSAASRSYPPALYNLGLCYEMGVGVNTDEKTAMELYRSAAALEHPGALYNLGIYYGQGRGGLARDTATATRLLKLAAVQGQQEAMEALKALDADLEEPEHNTPAVQPWSGVFNAQFPAHDNIVPIPTTLFVENVNYCPQKMEATVY